MAKQLVAVIEPNRAGAQEPAHAPDQVRLGRFHHHVEVVAHQAIGMNLPAGFLASLGQGFQKILPVDVVQKNVLAAVAAAHDVVNSAWVFHPDFAGHGSNHSKFIPIRPSKNEPCYGLTPQIGRASGDRVRPARAGRIGGVIVERGGAVGPNGAGQPAVEVAVGHVEVGGDEVPRVGIGPGGVGALDEDVQVGGVNGVGAGHRRAVEPLGRLPGQVRLDRGVVARINRGVGVDR